MPLRALPRRFGALFAAALCLACLVARDVSACNDMLLVAEDGYIHGRSMEFHIPLMVTPLSVARGTRFSTKDSRGGQGMSWTNSYAYCGLASRLMAASDILDGINEKGLSIGALWLADTQFPARAEGKNAIASTRVISYLLGACATVAEVREAFATLRPWGEPITALRGVPRVHLACADASGGYIVVEFTSGAVAVYDNPLQGLTNGPAFPAMQQQVLAGAPLTAGARRLSEIYQTVHKKVFASREVARERAVAFFQAHQRPFALGKTYSQWYVVKDLKTKTLSYYEGDARLWELGIPK